MRLVIGMEVALAGVSAAEAVLDWTRLPVGLSLTARCSGDTHRVVWQESARPLDGVWRSVAVGVATNGVASWERGTTSEMGFFRVLPRHTLGFVERLGRVREVVLATWPEARLLEASFGLDVPVDTAPDAYLLRAVFAVNGGSVLAWDPDPTFPVETEFRDGPFLGDQVLEWPIRMELEVAESRLREAGFGSAYRTVTLRQPVYPGMIEPYFIFGTEQTGFVFVGSQTGSVQRAR